METVAISRDAYVFLSFMSAIGIMSIIVLVIKGALSWFQ